MERGGSRKKGGTDRSPFTRLRTVLLENKEKKKETVLGWRERNNSGFNYEGGKEKGYRTEKRSRRAKRTGYEKTSRGEKGRKRPWRGKWRFWRKGCCGKKKELD